MIEICAGIKKIFKTNDLRRFYKKMSDLFKNGTALYFKLFYVLFFDRGGFSPCYLQKYHQLMFSDTLFHIFNKMIITLK